MITEWRRYNTDYPLSNSQFEGLVCDASFVLFDYETPVLQSITLTDVVRFTFTFDGATPVFFVLTKQNCQQDAVLELYYLGRYYGFLVLGPRANRIAGGFEGTNITVGSPFHLNTVRFINSHNGVYSLQGKAGNVSLTTSDDLLVSSGSISAISVPNKLQTFSALPGTVQVWNPATQQLIDTDDLTNTNLINQAKQTGFGTNISSAKLDQLVVVDTALVGVSYNGTTNKSTLYDCSAYPWTAIRTIASTQILALAWQSSNLYALTPTAVVNLGPSPYSGSTTYSLAMTGLKNLASVNGFLVASKTGPYDANATPHSRTSDLFYKITLGGGSATTKSCGVLTYKHLSSPPDFHLPTTTALGVSGSNLLVLAGTNIYQIAAGPTSINAATATLLKSIECPLSSSNSLVSGVWSMTFSPVTPLKTINSATPSNNNIMLIGSGPLTVNKTGTGELTIDLNIADSVLNVKRTQHYE